METITQDVTPESSPEFAVPSPSRDPEGYTKWRVEGASAPKPAPVAAKQEESSAKVEQTEEKHAPASEAGNKTQEKKQRSNADTRLTELLNDLRDAGLTPAQLKSFKQDYQKRETQQAEPTKAPEQTVNPADPKSPVKPKLEDFKTYEEYDAAKDKYFEDLADFKAEMKVREDRQRRAQEAAQEGVRQKMEDARSRYGDEGVSTISAAARAITGDQQMPQAITAMLNDSKVWPDLLYTLGGKAEDLASFVHLAKTNPGAAIRKLVVMEGLIEGELSKGKPNEETDRDESGKFTKKSPEKQESKAPPPPREVSGRGTTPPDEVDSAVRNGDFRQFRNAQNERDVARLRGR